MYAKQFFIGCICLLTALAQTALAETKPVLDIQTWQTNNGVPVYFVQAKEIPMVDVQVVFNAGSAQDKTQSGIANFVNSVLNEGTTSANADQIAEQFDNVGAIYSASVSRDMASVGLRSLSDTKFLTPALKAFTSVLTTASFPPEAFQRVQKQILIGLEEQKQLPGAVASKAFFKALYDGQAYAHPVLGTSESIKALNASDLKNFYQQKYVAKNALVAIVGNVDKNTAMQISEQITKPLALGESAPAIPVANSATQAVMEHIPFPTTQTTILIGQVGISKTDPDYFPLLIGNYTLGGSGLISRLFKQVRDERGLAYNVSSGFVPLAARGPFVLGLQTRNDQSHIALDVTNKILNEFVKTGPTEKELEAAKKNIIGGFPLALASNVDILGQIISMGYYKLSLNYLDTYRDKVRAVTVEQIHQAFQKHINLNALVTITVGEAKKNVQTAQRTS